LTIAETDGPRLQKITLASKLGVSRPTLDKYLHMEGAPKPGEDKAYDVEEVTKWITEHSGTVTSAGEKKNLNDMRVEKLLLECEKLRHEIQVKKGEFISKREAADIIVPVMEELGAILTQTFEMELPSRYVGKDAVDCAKLNSDALDKVIARFKKGMTPFTA
jgi:predicted DNA-binding transcriptional regulator AlpA